MPVVRVLRVKKYSPNLADSLRYCCAGSRQTWVHSLPHPDHRVSPQCSRSPSPRSSGPRTSGQPASPGAGRGWSLASGLLLQWFGSDGNISTWISLTLYCYVLLATVILLVIVKSKLPTVVAATDQIAHTALVAIVRSAVTRSVTVALPLLTGLLRSTASLLVIVTAPAPLAFWRLQGLCRV